MLVEEKIRLIKLYDDATLIGCTVVDNETSVITDSRTINHTCINVVPGEYEFKEIIEPGMFGKFARLDLIEKPELPEEENIYD